MFQGRKKKNVGQVSSLVCRWRSRLSLCADQGPCFENVPLSMSQRRLLSKLCTLKYPGGTSTHLAMYAVVTGLRFFLYMLLEERSLPSCFILGDFLKGVGRCHL